MVKGIEKLTDRQVRNLKTPGRYPDGATLYLVVWPSGSKSWVQRLTIGGRRADLGLGGYPAMSLAQARRKAQDNRALAKSGGDPLAEKREEAMVVAMPTFEALARQHIAEHRHAWRNAKHAGQWLSTLETYAFPTIGIVKVNEIMRRQVVDVLSPIWHTKAETARRVRQRVRAVMDRAVALGYIDFNPAGDAINGALTRMPRVRAHHRCPSIPGASGRSRRRTGVHCQPLSEVSLRYAGADGLQVRRSPRHDLGGGRPEGRYLDDSSRKNEGRQASPRAPLPPCPGHPWRGS